VRQVTPSVRAIPTAAEGVGLLPRQSEAPEGTVEGDPGHAEVFDQVDFGSKNRFQCAGYRPCTPSSSFSYGCRASSASFRLHEPRDLGDRAPQDDVGLVVVSCVSWSSSRTFQ